MQGIGSHLCKPKLLHQVTPSGREKRYEFARLVCERLAVNDTFWGAKLCLVMKQVFTWGEKGMVTVD
jgi:hypothetical protein